MHGRSVLDARPWFGDEARNDERRERMTMGRLEGKIMLVTGAARGIGAVTAALFEREGATVIGADILPAGDNEAHRPLDVSDEASWAALADDIGASHGRIDGLVHCAGILRTGLIEEQGVEAFREIMAVNQLGTFLAIRSVVPLMRERGGSIVLVSSMAGMMGTASSIAYSSTKWAVRGMAKVAAIELLPLRIRVNSLHPSLTDTPMVAGYRDPSTMLDPAVIADMALFLASDASRASTGAEFLCNGDTIV